jgi:3-deoxy-manno-octulosonate cytidylyltransferase (CMP-KDO synthetase)
MTAVAESFVIVIPARYDSVRLPGKVLCDINGHSMIEHVWRSATRTSAAAVVVATDDERIAAVVRAFGGEAVMTSPDHHSGSDRIAECARALEWSEDQLIVNLQGDEPEMPPTCLEQVAALMTGREQAVAATLYWPIDSADEVADPNAVKIVVDGQGRALYFSRAPIPHPRGFESIAAAMAAGVSWYRHLGLYCYRNRAIQEFSTTAPTPLEKTEKLEQMRFLETGGTILAAQASEAIPAGIDTPADLERARARLVFTGEN